MTAAQNNGERLMRIETLLESLPEMREVTP